MYFWAVKVISPHKNPENQEVNDVLSITEDTCHLVVWNDDVNTFEWANSKFVR